MDTNQMVNEDNGTHSNKNNIINKNVVSKNIRREPSSVQGPGIVTWLLH